jgi:hypothetical protein
MHTILGKMLERMQHGLVLSDNGDGTDSDKMRQQLALLLADRAAHFVIDPKLVLLFRDEKVQASMVTLVKHGVQALPFDPMLVEWRDHRDPEFVHFVRLQTKPIVPPIFATQMTDHGYQCDIYAYPMTTCPGPETGDRAIVAMDIRDPMPLSWDGGKFPNPNSKRERPFVCWTGNSKNEEEEHLRDNLAMTSVRALGIALLMLNNKSVAKEHIDTQSLNKARMKNNKLPIPAYTVLKIGTIYDRHGKAVSNPTGRHMPVHWRCAHIREQRYGPGYSKVRPILIAATLVNFDSDTDIDKVPVPKHEVTT